MFSTQLSGLFSKVNNQEGLSIEEGARLLAQAVIGEGYIYIHGTEEMIAVCAEATKGEEPLKNSKPLSFRETGKLSKADRVLLISRFSTDSKTIQVAKQLQKEQIPFVAISGALNAVDDLASIADVHINTNVIKGLLPSDEGKRICFPSSIAALFIYHALKFTIDEILAEYNM